MSLSYAQLPDPHHSPEFYASVPGKRFVAWIIDTGITVALAVLVLPFTAFLGAFFFPLLVLIIGMAYRILTIAGSSATWGMRFMSIELRDSRAERLDLSQAFVHTLGFVISMSFFLIQIVSIVTMLGSARGQSLTDMALGMVMINRR